jgi:hypothetical protein
VQEPTAADLHANGLTLEDFGDQFTAYVWPDNWQTCMVFRWLMSQWNYGPGGPVGLRYEVFPEARLRFGIKPEDWPAICDDLQLMEDAALEEMRKPK